MALLCHGLQANFDTLVASVPSMSNFIRWHAVELAKKLLETLMEFARLGNGQLLPLV